MYRKSIDHFTTKNDLRKRRERYIVVGEKSQRTVEVMWKIDEKIKIKRVRVES